MMLGLKGRQKMKPEVCTEVVDDARNAQDNSPADDRAL